MQIMYPTAVFLDFKSHPFELFNPEINIQYGWKYLNKQGERYNWDPVLVSASYNTGGVYHSFDNSWRIRQANGYLDRFTGYYNSAIELLKKEI